MATIEKGTQLRDLKYPEQYMKMMVTTHLRRNLWRDPAYKALTNEEADKIRNPMAEELCQKIGDLPAWAYQSVYACLMNEAPANLFSLDKGPICHNDMGHDNTLEDLNAIIKGIEDEKFVPLDMAEAKRFLETQLGTIKTESIKAEPTYRYNGLKSQKENFKIEKKVNKDIVNHRKEVQRNETKENKAYIKITKETTKLDKTIQSLESKRDKKGLTDKEKSKLVDSTINRTLSEKKASEFITSLKYNAQHKHALGSFDQYHYAMRLAQLDAKDFSVKAEFEVSKQKPIGGKEVNAFEVLASVDRANYKADKARIYRADKARIKVSPDTIGLGKKDSTKTNDVKVSDPTKARETKL